MTYLTCILFSSKLLVMKMISSKQAELVYISFSVLVTAIIHALAVLYIMKCYYMNKYCLSLETDTDGFGLKVSMTPLRYYN